MRAAWLGAVLGACTSTTPIPEGMLTVSQEQQSSWVRNFNPLVSTEVRWPTRAGIYEPLAIHNAVKGEWVPWLAESWTWSEDALTLTVQVRSGVKWSDGTPMRPEDVLFTFQLLREVPALDGGGLWQELEDVSLTEAGDVAFAFRRAYAPGFGQVASLPVVAEHVWAEVEDPVIWANPEPVGTGPFTEIVRFDSQEWVLGRNPHYWQEGKPAVEAMRFPALPSNDAANLALVMGEVDWAGNFVPAIDRTFVARDPEHHGYWFPAVGGAVMLYPNHTSAPLDRVEVRRAVSLAIDRDLLVQVAMYDYVDTAHPTGLPDGLSDWRIDPGADHPVRHAPDEVSRLLDEAGFTLGSDGLRRGPDGEVLALEVMAPAGWSDWVRAAQVISRNLQDCGIDAKLRTYDFSAWFEKLTRGDYDLSLGWTEEGDTPHGIYRGLMSARHRVPRGESASRNWERYDGAEADALLSRMEASVKREEQRALGVDLQQIFLRDLPAIPLFPSPSWGEYNSKRFVGWPNAENPYVRLSPNHPPETLLVMTQLEPRP